tara:strand:- start:2517 stop:2714 length:198 start_codon:yes stop_codon:yes gene_type:complete
MPKTSKCIVCKKRDLMNMKCRCGKTTCMTHRFPDDHNCEFDYKSDGKKQLEKENPSITQKKIEVI